MGQFVPAALDLYHHGAWVPRSVPANVHPPGVPALMAAVWRIFGYSIISARLTMLLLASVGIVFSFLLTARLGRGQSRTRIGCAFTAALFLMATPVFYTQSMLVILDMPAMTFTVLALLLFLDERYVQCALICTFLVLLKETAITTPAVFAAWLWYHQKQKKTALYFVCPAVALGLWLLVLERVTGHWLGNETFARENITSALTLHHVFIAFLVRAWFLFISDGRWLATIALFVGWRRLRSENWHISFLVAGAQIVMVTVLGGAELDRYLLPVLPVLYAAVVTAAVQYPVKWRVASHVALAALLVLGWFWNPPYPYPYEDNLTMVDFVYLQKDAARYLEDHAPDKRIASVWPFTFAIQNPELGYVARPLKTVDATGLRLTDLTALDRQKFELLVVYSRYSPIQGTWLDAAPLRWFLRRLRRYYDVRVQATDEEIREGLGYVPIMRWTRRAQWIEIYAPLNPQGAKQD